MMQQHISTPTIILMIGTFPQIRMLILLLLTKEKHILDGMIQNNITEMLTDCMFLEEDNIMNEIIGDKNVTSYRNKFLVSSYYAVDQIN